MARYTFTCEHFNYNDFNGDEQDVASKHTTQFRADDLTTMLENFELFLRGSGFYFNGAVDIVQPDDIDGEEDLRAIDDFVTEQQSQKVMSHMVNDLMSNPFRPEKEVTISNEQYSFNFDNMAGAHDTYRITDEIDLTSINLDISPLSLSEYNISNIEFDLTTNMNDLVSIDLSDKVEDENCSLCKLPVSVMRLHQCFDPDCPCGAYRSQFHSDK